MSLRIAYTVNATIIAITDVVNTFVQNERMPIAATDNKINEKMNVWFFFIFYARLIIMILRSEPLTRFPVIGLVLFIILLVVAGLLGNPCD